MAVYQAQKNRKLKLKYGINVKPDKNGEYPPAVADRLVRGGLAKDVTPKKSKKSK